MAGSGERRKIVVAEDGLLGWCLLLPNLLVLPSEPPCTPVYFLLLLLLLVGGSMLTFLVR